MEQPKNYPENLFDKTSYIKNVDQEFLKLKQKYPDRVEKCLREITEKDVCGRIDFFRSRAPEELIGVIKNFTDEQLKDFAIRDLVIDSIILPEDEKAHKEEVQKLGGKITGEKTMTPEEIVDKIFGQEK